MALIQVSDDPGRNYRPLADAKAAKARRKALLLEIQSKPAAPTKKFSDPVKLIRKDRSR
jgi:hypothetical protein